MDAAILGTLCGLGMWILRFPYPALSGVVVAVTALIPVVGAFLGAAIAAFIILTVSPIKALFFIIYIVVLQQIDNKLIYPKVVGSYVNLESLWVLAAITIGGSLFGVVGMLCGVPIAATAYQLIKEDYNKRIAEEKRDEVEPAEGIDNTEEIITDEENTNN
jgi:predicted PurR-regulated permease PerM